MMLITYYLTYLSQNQQWKAMQFVLLAGTPFNVITYDCPEKKYFILPVVIEDEINQSQHSTTLRGQHTSLVPAASSKHLLVTVTQALS